MVLPGASSSAMQRTAGIVLLACVTLDRSCTSHGCVCSGTQQVIILSAAGSLVFKFQQFLSHAWQWQRGPAVDAGLQKQR